ncbi:hypothetical protein DFAR_340016 [Desulfarculales bacterium]
MLGFLIWSQPSKDERRLRAPLILLPVKLARQNVRGGFSLALQEDEPRFNLTLLEILQRDFRLSIPRLENDLPRDDSGLDVKSIWRQVATAVKDLTGWEVAEDVILGQFSFAKYLMWKDLVEHTAQLKQNDVVRHLIDTPMQTYQGQTDFVDPNKLDQVLAPVDNYCLLSADSSQLAAVLAADQERDFVLEGPPGTGKSQTIANIIAQCLAKDKTVLFVAEKTAALEVVYRRLKEVGLSDFCLELHFNKANKGEVLRQLAQSLRARGQKDRETWQQECARMQHLQGQLNALVKRLHYKHSNGLSVFAAMSKVMADRDTPRVPFSWKNADIHNSVTLHNLLDVATKLGINAAEVANAAGLDLVTAREWSPVWEDDLGKSLGEMVILCQEVKRTVAAFLSATGLPEVVLSRRGCQALAALAGLLSEATGREWGFLLSLNSQNIFARLREGLALAAQRQKLLARLSLKYRPETLSMDLGELRQTWQQAKSSWWLNRWFLRRRVNKRLLALAETDQSHHLDCGQDLELLTSIQEHDAKLIAFDDLTNLTANLWSGLETKSEDIDAAQVLGECLKQSLFALYDQPQVLAAAISIIQRLINENDSLLQPMGKLARMEAELKDAIYRQQMALDPLANLLAGGGEASSTLESVRPAALADQCRTILTHIKMLKSWCNWNRVVGEAHGLELGPLTEALARGHVASDHARQAFSVNYCRWWLKVTVDSDQVLKRFVTAEHEQAIKDFCKLDERLTHLAKNCVRANLCSRRSWLEDTRKSSEWILLNREIAKKRRHLPLRQLVEKLPALLPALTPCLLMSPLSIAQYLPPGRSLFDLVIFDEASQIPVWDAIGAMARGRRVIVVGDPKQLPPTNFFNRIDGEDADIDSEIGGNMESTLDECISAGLPTKSLNWHYRSRHESLIAFSNRHYYGGNLVTFPSSVTNDSAVSLHLIKNGIYDRGGSRTNQIEAKAVVADIVARLNDQDFVASGKSIGVVTFNSQQQKLIEDLLDEERRNDPMLEQFFADDKIEPIFVKNLESVQGDERDVMYFSITYGLDLAGRVSMNFGPLNRDGGERRLNVAISRARCEMKVFCSLLPDQIDLTRAKAKGVTDLKHFLSYAHDGVRALAEEISAPRGDLDSPFEEAVAKALSQLGWTVHTQIGVSDFRIDLGVVDPSRPGRYLAGLVDT